jgi:hypothetical protein
MNIILIMFSLILPIISLKQIKPKICINCKYFIPDNDIGKFGKCSLFPTEENYSNFLVNGISEENYYYCSTSRQSKDMCGEEGKYYRKKIVKSGRFKPEKVEKVEKM